MPEIRESQGLSFRSGPMKLWIDAQLSPALAPWLTATFQVEAVSLKFIGLRDSADREIFHAAREANAVLVSKDYDFVDLVEQSARRRMCFGLPAETRQTHDCVRSS